MQRADFFIAGFITLFFLSIVIWISYFGAPLTDESFPIATALRFIQGQRPFIDDYSPYIPIGLLLTPVVKLSLWIHHGKNELMLFLRHAYIIFSLCIAAYTFSLLKKSLHFMPAFFMAAAMVIYHPFGINDFHYDTVGVLLWTSLIFQFFSFQVITPNKLQLFLFSICNVLLCIAYPTFAFFLILFYGIYSSFAMNVKRIFLSHFMVGTLSLALFAALIFFYYHVSLQNIENTLVFSKNLFKLSSDKGIVNKFLSVFHFLETTYISYVLAATLVISLGYFFRKTPIVLSAAIYTVFILPFFLVPIHTIGYTEIFYILNCAGLTGLILFLFFLRQDEISNKLFLFIWLPAFMAGLLTSTTSYNLALNFNLGFFPASLLGFVFAFQIIKRPAIILGCLLLGFCQLNYIYGTPLFGFHIYDGAKKYPLEGPCYGIFMENASRHLLMTLQTDLKTLDKDHTRFVYFGTVAAGYLMVDQLRPGEYLLYSPYKLAHFGEKIRLPAYVFDFSKAQGTPASDINPYLLSEKSKPISSTELYDIYNL